MLMWFSINFDAQFPFLLMLSKYDAAQWLRGSVGLFSDSRTDRCHLWVNVPRVTTFPPLFMPIFFFRITDMKSFSSRLSVTFHGHFKDGSSTTFSSLFSDIFIGQHFLSDPPKISLSDLQKIFCIWPAEPVFYSSQLEKCQLCSVHAAPGICQTKLG